MKKTILVSMLLSCLPAFAAEISLQDYARHAQFMDVKISPSGKYLAISNRAEDDNVRVVVLERSSMKVKSQTHFRGEDTIADFYWANDERLLLTLAKEIGSLEVPQLTGEIYAVNPDGKRGLMLTGFRSKDSSPTSSTVIDFLPQDDKHVIISQRDLRAREPVMEFYRLNVDNGRQRRIGRAPIQVIRGGNFYALTDNDGLPRMVMGLDPKNDTDTVLMFKPDEKSDWQEFGRYPESSERTFIPLAFSADNKKVFGLSDLETDTKAITVVDLVSRQTEVLAHHPQTDVMPVMSMADGVVTDVIGASYEYDKIESVFFDNVNDSTFGKALFGLIDVFPASQVSLTSATKDTSLAVVKVQSVNQDPTFYLFDTKQNKLSYLLNSRPWLQQKKLPETQTVKYKARDGQEIVALLTLPKNAAAKNLPLILFPHGGPIGPRDSFADFGAYQMNIKMLAEHGYAVLQPNFRGSGSFGLSFQQAGYQQWGKIMIDDMTDGVLHLAETGIIDKQRVCTFGASYGGYAAVQTAIREPELYKCSVAYAAVFDLHALYTDGDVPETAGGVRFIERTVGRDASVLDPQSPIKNLDKLKAPVFIVHGEKDRRTPLSYATAFRAELDKRGHPYQWLVKDKEGHGFYNPENNVELWQQVLVFLDKHIGNSTL